MELRIKVLGLGILMMLAVLPLTAQESKKAPVVSKEMMMLTVHLKHDQSKTLGEIGQHLKKTEFWKKFPPQGVEVISWKIVMGIGHVIVLRLPPSKLRAVNLAIERCAWGGFKTEFYPTYDFLPVWKKRRAKMAAGK